MEISYLSKSYNKMKIVFIFFLLFQEIYSKFIGFLGIWLILHSNFFAECALQEHSMLYFFSNIPCRSYTYCHQQSELLWNGARKVHGERTSESVSRTSMHMQTSLRCGEVPMSLDVNATFTHKNCFLNLNPCRSKWKHDFSVAFYTDNVLDPGYGVI